MINSTFSFFKLLKNKQINKRNAQKFKFCLIVIFLTLITDFSLSFYDKKSQTKTLNKHFNFYIFFIKFDMKNFKKVSIYTKSGQQPWQ